MSLCLCLFHAIKLEPVTKKSYGQHYPCPLYTVIQLKLGSSGTAAQIEDKILQNRDIFHPSASLSVHLRPGWEAWLAGWLPGRRGWLARRPGWRAGRSGLLAGRPGWLAGRPGWLAGNPGWLAESGNGWKKEQMDERMDR